MRANLTSGSMRGDWRGGNSLDQSPTLLPSLRPFLFTIGDFNARLNSTEHSRITISWGTVAPRVRSSDSS